MGGPRRTWRSLPPGQPAAGLQPILGMQRSQVEFKFIITSFLLTKLCAQGTAIYKCTDYAPWYPSADHLSYEPETDSLLPNLNSKFNVLRVTILMLLLHIRDGNCSEIALIALQSIYNGFRSISQDRNYLSTNYFLLNTFLNIREHWSLLDS